MEPVIFLLASAGLVLMLVAGMKLVEAYRTKRLREYTNDGSDLIAQMTPEEKALVGVPSVKRGQIRSPLATPFAPLGPVFREKKTFGDAEVEVTIANDGVLNEDKIREAKAADYFDPKEFASEDSSIDHFVRTVGVTPGMLVAARYMADIKPPEPVTMEQLGEREPSKIEYLGTPSWAKKYSRKYVQKHTTPFSSPELFTTEELAEAYSQLSFAEFMAHFQGISLAFQRLLEAQNVCHGRVAEELEKIAKVRSEIEQQGGCLDCYYCDKTVTTGDLKLRCDYPGEGVPQTQLPVLGRPEWCPLDKKSSE